MVDGQGENAADGSDVGRRGEPGFLDRLHRHRWVVGVAALTCIVLTLVDPFIGPLLIAAMVIICLLVMYPPGETQTDGLAQRRSRPRVDITPGQQTIAETLDFPAYILDERSNLVFANKAAVAAFGSVRPGQSITLKFRGPELVNLIQTALASGERQKMEYHEKVPTERWYKVDIAMIPSLDNALKTQDGKKRNAYFLLVFRDVSESRRIDIMRTDFIANASHELRTPLTSLRGYVETMQGGAKDDEKARELFLPIMLEQAERMSRLINDLLSLSRIEMQSHIVPDETVDLVEIVQHARIALSKMADEMGVNIKTELPKKLMVRGDRDELIQVVENLVENACKYGQDGRKVVVGIEPREEDACTVELYVQDFGPGIAPEHVSRLTERFYRVDVETSRAKQGTGLGLAIVKHILMRHQSRLQVQTDIGKGSRFSAVLKISGNDSR